MFILTHLLMGWLIAQWTCYHKRDLALVTAAAVFPALDGFGILLDAAAALGGASTEYFHAFHRQLTHGLPAAVLMTLLSLRFASDQLKTTFWVMCVFHLHLLLDTMITPSAAAIAYLSPLPGQWDWTATAQSGVHSLLICGLLMVCALHRCITTGCTPVYLFSTRCDLKLVKYLRAKFRALYKPMPLRP